MRASDLRALDTQGWTPEVRISCGVTVLGKLSILDPRVGTELDPDEDGFGGRFNHFQDRGGIIGKVMGRLSAPGSDQILAEIRKPKNFAETPVEAGSWWPGRDWESPGPDIELAPEQLAQMLRAH